MTESQPQPVDVRYGHECQLALSVDSDRLVARREAPDQLDSPDKSIRDALAAPLDFPPLAQAVIPGDHIVIALDNDTPAADVILSLIHI